ncbi:MAG: GNAT family N-acetyltransferase [Fibrobacteres bacterium]|nr:GNAT family N-acetyltransferase [Fibrobacterota bacterium]
MRTRLEGAAGEYEIDDDFGRLDFRVLEGWLTAAYWSPGIRMPEILQGARNSALNLGCYRGGEQVGYLRVASDRTRFAFIMDVYVDDAHRRRGLARTLVAAALSHPDLADVYHWALATRDAQPVYAQVGFGPLPVPGNWMNLRKEKIRPPVADGA